MQKTKIEWCDSTWNPVWGCKNNCEYCYARKIAKRFGEKIADKELNYINKNGIELKDDFCVSDLTGFVPTWLWSNFYRHFPPKYRRSKIFVNSMSDIYFWKEEWTEQVINRIAEYPEHVFLFLTKFPQVYDKYVFPKNCWLGVSITGVPDTNIWTWTISNESESIVRQNNKIFVSIEPLLEEPTDRELAWLGNFDWVIIGGLTPEPKHKQEWIDSIRRQCKGNKIPVFTKRNLWSWKRTVLQEKTCYGFTEEFPKE